MGSCAESGTQTGAWCTNTIDDVARVEGAEEGSEGGDGGGYKREVEDCFGEDAGDDAGEGWVGILWWGEVEEADRGDGNESVGR